MRMANLFHSEQNNEVNKLLRLLELLSARAEALAPEAQRLKVASQGLSEYWSKSSRGSHGDIYWLSFGSTPPRVPFNTEWGTVRGMPHRWRHTPVEEVKQEIAHRAKLDIEKWVDTYEKVLKDCRHLREHLVFELKARLGQCEENEPVSGLLKSIEAVDFNGEDESNFLTESLNGYAITTSRDRSAILSGGIYTPAHLFYECKAQAALDVPEKISLVQTRTKLVIHYIERFATWGYPDMSFDDLPKQRFILVCGSSRHEFKGIMSKGKITTFETSLKYEHGATIEHPIPAGGSATFTLSEISHQPQFGSIPEHMRLEVRPKSEVPPTSPVTNIYNLQGQFTGVNVGSHDASISISNVIPTEMFDKLQAALDDSVSDPAVKHALVECLSMMRSANSREQYVSAFQKFMTASATVMTIVGPFLPALSQLISSH